MLDRRRPGLDMPAFIVGVCACAPVVPTRRTNDDGTRGDCRKGRPGHRRSARARHRSSRGAAARARGRRRRLSGHRAPVRRFSGLRCRWRRRARRGGARDRGSGRRALALRADVSSWDDVHAAVAQAHDTPAPSTWCCNVAGGAGPGMGAGAAAPDRRERDGTGARRQPEGDVDGGARMRERMVGAGRGGRIVNVSSRPASGASRCSAPTAPPRPASSS